MGIDQKIADDERAILETGEPLEGSGFENESEADSGDLEVDNLDTASNQA